MAERKRRRKQKGRFVAREQLRIERAQTSSVSLTYPGVIELGDPSLREAYRRWWHPIDMGPDFDALTGQAAMIPFKRGKRHGFTRVPAKRPVERGDQIERRRLDPGYYRRIERALLSARDPKGRRMFKKPRRTPSRRAPVKVLITLTYPLCEKRSKVVTIDRRYPGEIFALTHDFYRELYAEDERSGGKAGPMSGSGGPLLNRGRGPLVWGHDLGDLVLESCQYRAFDKARARQVGAEGEFTFGVGS